MCFAPATAPKMADFWFSFDNPFPALNCAPPLENWMITGAFNLAAVSKTPLIVLDPTTLTAGNANPFCFA